MDSNSNPITNANPGMPAIPSSPAPAPVVPTPSDMMPSIPAPVDNTVPPVPTTSSVPTFASNNPAANAAPVVPTTSSTPTSFGLDSSSYNAGTVASSTNGSFDPSSVASFFTPETPSLANGGMIAATEPITEPDPIPEPDPVELELNAPFQAAAPVPGSIGSAVSVPKEAPAPKEEKKAKKGGLFGKKSAPAEEKATEPAPLPANEVIDLNSTSTVLSSEPIVNPNNPFLAQNAAPAIPEAPAAPEAPVAPAAAVPETPVVAEAPAALETSPVAPVAPVTQEAPVAPVLENPMASVAAPAMDAQPAVVAPEMQAPSPAADMNMMNSVPNPEVPAFDPNLPLPMPGDPMMAAPMVDPMQNMAMPPVSPDMPFAQDFANNQMNPFAEAAALNADPNMASTAPAKADNKKKLLILGGAAAGVLLLIILVVVMMSGESKKSTVANNPTPAPTPAPAIPTSGTTICTKKYDADRLASFSGAENGSRNITIKYEDDEITSVSMNDTIDFDNETSRKSGLRTLKDEYNADLEKYSIEDNSVFTTEYDRDVLSITGTRALTSLSDIETGTTKLFSLVSGDGGFMAEDTVAGLEDNGYTCSEKGATDDVDEDEEDLESPNTDDVELPEEPYDEEDHF